MKHSGVNQIVSTVDVYLKRRQFIVSKVCFSVRFGVKIDMPPGPDFSGSGVVASGSGVNSVFVGNSFSL